MTRSFMLVSKAALNLIGCQCHDLRLMRNQDKFYDMRSFPALKTAILTPNFIVGIIKWAGTIMVPAHFHDVTHYKMKLDLFKNTAGPHLNHS